MDERVKVGVVGAGRMGTAMVRRLRSRGADVVVFNRTRSKAEAVARDSGAVVADTAAEAAAAAPVVLVSLADDRAVVDAYGGPSGVVAGASPGTVVAETSTIEPATVGSLAAMLAGHGARLVDTPVSGSVPSVKRGELTVLAGGDAADLARARPMLDLLAGRVLHIGASGTGAAMKLAVNTALHGLNQALSESLVLAERAGVERSTAYDAFAASAVAAPYLHYKRNAFEHPDRTPVAFTLDLAAKDLDLALGLAARLGVPLAQAEANRGAVAEAIEAGLGDRDMSALASLLRDRDRPAD